MSGFLVLSLLMSVVVALKLNEVISETRRTTVHANFTILRTFLNTYLQERVNQLHDHAKFPILIQAVMQPDQQPDLVEDFVGELRLLGESHPLVLTDFQGHTIHSTKESWHLDYTKAPWLEGIMGGTIPHHVGFNIIQGSYVWEIVVPILFNGNPEGVLVGSIPIGPTHQLQGLAKQLEDAQLQLFHQDRLVSSWGTLQEMNSMTMEQADVWGLRMKYFVNDSDVTAATYSLLFPVLLMSLSMTGLCGFFAVMLGRKLLITPLEQLKTHSSDLLDETTISFLPENQTIEELRQLATHFNVVQKRAWERKEKILDINRSLEARIEERTNTLAEANIKLQEESRTREQMQQSLRNALEGIAFLDIQGVYRLVNQSYAGMTGYQPDEFIDKAWSSTVYPDDIAVAKTAFENMMESGKGEFEARAVRKDGSTFYKQVVMVKVLDEQGIMTGHHCFMKDITVRKEAEAERDRLNKELVDTSRRVGMADVATGVLHNVGNVLNSVNVAAGVVSDIVRRSSLDKVSRTAGLIQDHLDDVGHYLTHDPKGQQIPEYLHQLGQQLTKEQESVLGELKGLMENIEHIKGIISVQQIVAKSGSLEEPVVLEELLQQALSVSQTSLDKYQVEVTKDYAPVPEIVVDKHQVLQVLVNLVSNAKHAMKKVLDRPRILTVRIASIEEQGSEWIKLEVSDTGVGISSENMKRMFTQGFTTKKDGHGFGLHSGSLSAKLMGGSLTVHSDGEGQGATFSLTLPVKRREVGVV